MAAGKPVVTRRAEGVDELLGELGRDQIVDRLAQKEVVADRLIQFAQNPQISADLGERNRKRAEREFSLDAMIAKYEQLYASILDG
jgi:glycosyltransferase involved in cell wall biosynthesis